MRILLIHSSHINPEGTVYRGKKSWIHGIGLPLLAASTPPGIEIRLLNDAVHVLPVRENWDLVGISIMGVSLYRAIHIARLFRSRGCKIVMGGKTLNQHADIVSPYTDTIVQGEAEELWPEVVVDAGKNSLKDAYGNPGYMTDLYRLPVPRYELVDRQRHGPFFPVEASRGCPNHCDFCVVSPWSGHRHRIRPVSHVIRDIKALKKLKINLVAFMDDNLTAHREYALELFRALRPLQIHWISQMSTTALHDVLLLEAAALSGCTGLSIGFESINQKNLDKAGKSFNKVETYKEGLEHLHRLGIVVAPLIITGFDHDSFEGFEQLITFLNRMKVALPLLYLLTPAPGSVLYNRLKAENRILPKDLSYYNLMHVVFKPKLMSPQELETSFWNIYRKIYSLPRIMKRTGRQTGSLLKQIITFFINLNVRNQVKKHILPGTY